MFILADTETIGSLVWFKVGVIIAAVFLIAAVVTLLADEYGLALGCFVCAVLAGGITVACMWPFKYDYHHWVDKKGEVTAVSKRLVPAGDKGMQEKVVFRIAGHDQPYGVLDTRASLVKAGERVHLRCKKQYEWGSTHGWDCRWAGT